MTLCKKCNKPIKFTKIEGKFRPINLDGSEHDYDLCRYEQNMRFKNEGTRREGTREYTDSYGPQKVTTVWYDLNGESLKFEEGPFLAYPH